MEKLSLKTKKVATHNMRKMLPLYAENKGMLALIMFFLIGSGIVGIAMPILSANALASLAMSNFEKAIFFTSLMCGIGILKIIFNALDEYFYVKLNAKLSYKLTDKIINAINQTKMRKIDSTHMGYFTERLSSDVGMVSDMYLTLLDLSFSILTNVVFLLYIATLNLYIFFILLAYVAVLYIICVIKSRIWMRGKRLTKKAKDKARSAYYEQIAGIRDVKLLNMKKNVTDYSNEKYADALKIELSVNNKRNVVRRVQSSVSIVFELVFLLIGIAFVKEGAMLLAGLLVIYTYYGRIDGLVSYISNFKEWKADGEISATRIFELIEDPEKEIFGEETIENFEGTIEFKDVKFAYEEGVNVLKGLSMTFEPSKITAIVGKSGCGKTTILSLLSKLYDANEGEILFDGKNITCLTEEFIHGNIGEISQAPYIFNTSIRQNLLFVKPNATEEELIAVLKKAQIYNDIQKIPNGIDAEIGENGIKLSGGQKQRVAIARLLLMNSKVIVFDEATSALDNESQKKIVEMLETLKNEKTIIIVAHRLSSIVGADKIYMLDSGKVLSSGTHKELMKKCKEYKELYKLEEESAKVDIEGV